MSGPFLYDDEPAPLHTGPGRRRNGLLLALLLGTVAVAIGMVAAISLVKGSPAEQSEETVGVFLAALGNGDRETAYGLLCEEVRAGAEPGDIPPEYRLPTPAEVVDSERTELDGAPVYVVEVRSADGTATSFTVVNQDGPHLCGTSPAG
jgi:hypothetical protein